MVGFWNMVWYLVNRALMAGMGCGESGGESGNRQRWNMAEVAWVWIRRLT